MQFGQFALHPEQEVYRLVITTAGSTVHPVLGTFTTKGCIPAASALAHGGTISTDSVSPQDGKIVLGVGTSFIADVEVGDFLTNTDGIVRRVTAVDSETMLHIEAKFPSDLSGATATMIRKAKLFTAVEAKSTGTAAAILQEQAFAVADTFQDAGAPVSYDVSGTNAGISFTLHL